MLDELASSSSPTSSNSRIHSIREFPEFRVRIDLRNPGPSRKEIDRLTEEVGADCPVARRLMAESSTRMKLPGEGIVWKCVECSSSRQWFKSKCVEHAVVASTPKSKNLDTTTDEKVKSFVERFVTPARLRQGLDHLREFNLPADSSSTGAFVKWVSGDTLTEGAADIEEDTAVERRDDFKKAASRAVSQEARRWYRTVYEMPCFE